MAPRLQSHNLRPSNFEKMKVRVSTNLISDHVSTSLGYLSHELEDSKFEATAWFCRILLKWFNHRNTTLKRLWIESFSYKIK